MLSEPTDPTVAPIDPESDPQGTSDQPADIVIGIRQPQSAARLMSHGMALANAFGGEVVLLHAMETPSHGSVPVDPIEWDIHRRDIESLLGQCAKKFETPDRTIRTCILEGSCLEQISAFMAARPRETVIIIGEGQSLPQETGKFSQAVLASGQGSILRVPSNGLHRNGKGYGRILVPIDGSSRAESVLPRAVRLASAERSELILCYVTPPPGVAEIGVTDDEAIALRKQITKRNARIGKSYLDSINDRLSGAGVAVSTRTVVGEDARRSLLQVANDQGADLIVIASHGQSGYCDVPAGDVASFVLKRSGIPVLMLRQDMKPAQNHAFSGAASEGVRQPTDSKP